MIQLEVQTSTSSYLLLIHLETIVYIVQKKVRFFVSWQSTIFAAKTSRMILYIIAAIFLLFVNTSALYWISIDSLFSLAWKYFCLCYTSIFWHLKLEIIQDWVKVASILKGQNKTVTTVTEKWLRFFSLIYFVNTKMSFIF